MQQHYDAIVIGAGISGLYQLLKLRELGLSVRVFEAGTGVGGTWYWNRYPGARFDSESYSYGYSFSPSLLRDWEWSEHFAAQPETLRYLDHVADRFELRRDIEFRARVVAAHYDEARGVWKITLADGRSAVGRYLVTGVGSLSAPVLPAIDGRESFRGIAHHTAHWPHAGVEFAGRRVAVIGTGATGVQVIQEVAKTCGRLTVFQRTPNWCAPLGNSPISPGFQARLKEELPAMLARCKESFAGFLHQADRRTTFEVGEAERRAFYEDLYRRPGFAIWLGNFADTLVDERANAELSRFIADKIRARVQDPALAERLIPRDHGFGTRRVPLETGYYEVYNQPNVELVDVRETPLLRITETGIETGDGHREFDVIVYATGFDAVTGALDRIDVAGLGGQRLKDQWAEGPRTYLGMTARGFPDFFFLVGPHNAASFCNIPRCIEQNVEWVAQTIGWLERNGRRGMQPREDAVDAWTTEVLAGAERFLFSKVRSWFMGMNTNLPDRQRPRFLLYAGGLPQFRQRCADEAAAGYPGFDFG